MTRVYKIYKQGQDVPKDVPKLIHGEEAMERALNRLKKKTPGGLFIVKEVIEAIIEVHMPDGEVL